MAISVNWVTGRIYIPKADTTYQGLNPFSQEIRELDIDALRLTLRDLEDDPNGGRPWPRTHNHETETLLAGITYVRKVIFLAPYYFEFESGNYRVNLTAENNNLVDRLYYNGVTVVPANSAGGQVVETGTSGLTAAESAQLNNINTRSLYADKIIKNKKALEKRSGTWYLVIYDNDNSTEILQKELTDFADGSIDDLVAGTLAKELLNSV